MLKLKEIPIFILMAFTLIYATISILLFIALRFFIHLEFERYYTIIPFTICLIAIIKLETKKK